MLKIWNVVNQECAVIIRCKDNAFCKSLSLSNSWRINIVCLLYLDMRPFVEASRNFFFFLYELWKHYLRISLTLHVEYKDHSANFRCMWCLTGRENYKDSIYLTCDRYSPGNAVRRASDSATFSLSNINQEFQKLQVWPQTMGCYPLNA